MSAPIRLILTGYLRGCGVPLPDALAAVNRVLATVVPGLSEKGQADLIEALESEVNDYHEMGKA